MRPAIRLRMIHVKLPMTRVDDLQQRGNTLDRILAVKRGLITNSSARLR